MNRIIYISLFILIPLVSFPQDPKTPVADYSYKNLSFDQFVFKARSELGIEIFYRQEWTMGLIVDFEGDSITIDHLLSDLFNERGINIFEGDAGQYFLTGEIRVDKISSPVSSLANGAENGEDNREKTLFKSLAYEKTVQKAVIGNRSSIDASGNSLLSGRIRSATSGEPVIGATVVIEGTSNGVITDTRGFYALQLRPGNTYNMTVSCLGMQKESFIVEVYSSGTLNIEMREQLIDIQEVVVRAGTHDNVRGMQMGFQRIDIKEIKSIPVVMGERDILKIAQMMPGVQTVGEGASGFNVRGSTSDQNLFLLNGIPVLNTGHLFGFFSAFNPDMVNEFNLYKNSFPAEYGGRLASVFEVNTRKGNKKSFGARGGVSPVTGSLLVETPIIKDKSSFILGARSTYSDWILKRLDNADLRNSNASFYDIMTGIHIIPDQSSSLQLFGYTSSDQFSFAGTNKYSYQNIGSSVLYDRNLNEKWTLNLSGIFSRYLNYHSNTEVPQGAYEHQFTVNHNELKFKVRGYQWMNHTTTAGGGAIYYDLNHGIYSPAGDESNLQPTDFGSERGVEYYLYAADEYAISEKLTLYGGLRFSGFNYLGPKEIYTYSEGLPREQEFIRDTVSYNNRKTIKSYSGPEYRLSVNLELAEDLSLKAGINRMRQYLFMLSNTVAMSPTDRWKLTDPHIIPPVSDQASVGIYKNFQRNALETSAEVYYKITQNQVEYKDGADLSFNPLFETSILQGRQNAWGAELLVKRNAGRFTGWVSYAYSRSIVTVDGQNTWEKINGGVSFPANFDKPHSLNLVANYKYSRRISLASNLVYSTGRPISYPIGSFQIEGEEGVIYSGRNEYRIPDYFRIDISLNFEGSLLRNKVAHGSWMLAVYNLTGRRNAYSVFFKSEEGSIKGYKQSIYGVPILTISYNFKLGNYAVD